MELVCDKASITLNKNAVFGDRSALSPGGVRIGTPALTTRGFKEKEIIQVSNWICEIIYNFDNEELQNKIKNEVSNLTNNFPVYNL